MDRRKSKVVKIGKVSIGGNNPVAVQSMVKIKTSECAKVINQIRKLEASGCEIARLAVKDNADAKSLKKIKSAVKIPLVADIHFDWRLALLSIDSGVDKIRLNPGNIFKDEQVRLIAAAATRAHIPIRVGLNSGSVPVPYGKISASGNSLVDRMCKSALSYIKMLEGFGFNDIVVSLKASNSLDTIKAYRKMAAFCDYPFHLGVTATGLPIDGIVKSSIALGSLLQEGIGDTIRVSLTDEPCQEVKVSKSILQALQLRDFGPEIISCPTCGRCEVNLKKVVDDLEDSLADFRTKKSLSRIVKPVKIALMGCVVNGPGESKEADIGIAFGKYGGLLFKKGKPVRKVPFNNCVDVLMKELSNAVD